MFRRAQYGNEHFLCAVSCRCERSEAIERHGIFHDSRIPCLLIATLVILARNDKRSATKVAPPKIPFVMLSEAKHLLDSTFLDSASFHSDSPLGFFFKGDRGANCHSKHVVLACHDSLPPIPLKSPQPLHAIQLIVLRTDYVMLHSACVNVMPTARTLPLCAVAGKIES